MTLRGRNFLQESDFTPAEWLSLVELSHTLKEERSRREFPRRLDGLQIALIFEKTSTRTRCAFEVAAADEGASTTYLDPAASQLGHKESIADTARVLGRMYDAIEFRGAAHADVLELAAHAGVPVYNGLTDDWHPTQMLADTLTITEHVDKPLGEVVTTYIGDGRFNTGRSFLVSGALAGMDTRLIAPAGYTPPADVIDVATKIAAETGGRITVTDEVEAVAGSDAVSTDVWVSMGEPADVWEERIAALLPYQVTSKVMDAAGENAVFMHCLPAFHNLETTVGRQVYERFGLAELEVTDEVFESERSVVFDQAENRMHTIKAVLVATLA